MSIFAHFILFFEIILGISVAYTAWLAIEGDKYFTLYSAFLASCVWLVEKFRKYIQRKSQTDDTSDSSRESMKRSQKEDDTADDEHGEPAQWHGVLPKESKYRFKTTTEDSLPLGTQIFSYEYAPQGHAEPLKLRNTLVRANIQFTCRLKSPYKAIYEGGEYGLNILPPRFLTHARDILETYSLSKLRKSRKEASDLIKEEMAIIFEKYGFEIEQVIIGDLTKINSKK